MAKKKNLQMANPGPTPSDDDSDLLDPRDLKNDGLLSSIQGNILKGHGRDNTVHMLVWFDKTKMPDVKKWIAKFAEEKMTSFKEQLRQREVYKRNGVSGGLFAGLYLTAKFYEDFEFGTDAFKPFGQPFIDGMQSRKQLEDDYSQVEDVYRQGELLKTEPGEPEMKRKFIHAMILLAHADIISLNIAAHEVCEAFSDYDPHDTKKEKNPIAEVITTEYGSAIRNANGDGLEHFGYVDGISQPLFLQEDMKEYREQNVKTLYFNPKAQKELVLVPDPFVKDEPNAYGSYFVFRKLEQNVRGFKEAEHKLGETIFGEKADDEVKERAGAMIVGRFEDGTPVTLSEKDKMISSGIMNNFDYEGGAIGNGNDTGARCPYHGHIRKTNPRTPNELAHRMARRGITYGHRNVSTTVESSFVQMPTSGVGLLFMSFQANIAEQFEHIQKAANNDRFTTSDEQSVTSGIDLLIGQVVKKEDETPEQYRARVKQMRTGSYAEKYNIVSSLKPCDFSNFITFRGGEYFFAPSIPFLKSLKPEED